MKKKIVVFFLFLFASQTLLAKTYSNNIKFCSSNSYKFNINQKDSLKINHINIKVHDFRKWTVNGLKVLIGNFRWVSDKYKKRFKADLVVGYSNKVSCKYSATIRHSGNQKDHVNLKNNNISQSVDVHLNKGNIKGISKFKLLLNHTRGNYIDEIILTELLRELNYISPRTSFVETEINGVKTYRIFQEKPSNAMLKYHAREEQQIFESDERFVFRLAKTLPDNNLSNWSLGLVPLLEKGINSMLARQVNKDLIIANNEKKINFYKTLSNLNYIYSIYSNTYKNNKNNYFYGDYTLNNNLLGFYNKANVEKLEIYNLLVSAANGHHTLSANNRRFYWNKNKNYFEPINYDNNSNIEAEYSKLIPPFTSETKDAFNKLNNLLNNLDISEFEQQISIAGLNLKKETIKNKVNKIKSNLKKLKDIYFEYDHDFTDDDLEIKNTNNLLSKYFNSVAKVDNKIKIVKYSLNQNIFKVCEALNNCVIKKFTDKEIIDLLVGRLVINKIEYQFFGIVDDKNRLLRINN